MSEQFQRTHSVLFLHCIELRTKAVLSSDPAFSEILLSFVIAKSDRLNKSKVESGKTVKTRASQGTNPIGIGEKNNKKSRLC